METLLRWFMDNHAPAGMLPPDLRPIAGVSTCMRRRRLRLRDALARLAAVPVRRVRRVVETEYPLPLLTAPDH